MITLGIETSCDETGLALYSQSKGLLAHIVDSQIILHNEFGGVVPEVASREHANRIVNCMDKLLNLANLNVDAIDAVAYTAGPGLVGALMVGACFAHSFATARLIPKFAINHLEGHLFSCWLPTDQPKWPCLLLLVSGGHTALIYAKGLGDYEILGQTLDDAAGEALDKVAKLLGLPYPGGAHLSKLAQQGVVGSFDFNVPLQGKPGFDFSFSGLKSAAHRVWAISQQSSRDKANLAIAFENVVVESLVSKLAKAMDKLNCDNILLAGGVSANLPLRQEVQNLVASKSGCLYMPNLEFCGDNGAMIAAAGSYRLQAGVASLGDAIQVYPKWSLDSLVK